MKSTTSSVRTQKRRLPIAITCVLAGGFVSPSVVLADTQQCSAGTLRGAYLFHASGYNIVNGAALPKAIIETVIFDGLGNVTTPEVSLSVNGIIVQPPQGNPGNYTVDADCTGTLTFADGPKFDLQIAPNGKSINLLQTNPNTVMEGTAERVPGLDKLHD